MKVILPVAGKGLRLRPHTLTRPKCLLPVSGNTIIGHIIDLLKDVEISEFVFITGYMGESVKEYIKSDYPNINATFVIQENPQGLGEAISLCDSALNSNEDVMIILGDTVFESDLSKISKSDSNVLCVRQVDDPSRFGVVITDDSGRITKLVEKPKDFVSDQAIVGIYFIKDTQLLNQKLNHIVSNDIRTRGEFQLTDALELMIQDGAAFKPAEIEAWLDCGTSQTMIETNTKLLETHNNNYTSKADSKIIEPCFIADDAVIEDSVIGPNVSVFSGSVVKSSTISNSVISKKSTIIDCKLDNSIVGEEAEVLNTDGIVNISDCSTIGKLTS